MAQSTQQPVTLNVDDLNTRHNQFLREIRSATSPTGSTEKMMQDIQSAQKSYANWFAGFGIKLVFTP